MLRSAAIVSVWTLLSRVLGLLRDRLLAMVFGAGSALDAFLVAFALPNMLRNLFGEGALAAAFIPRLVQQQQSDQQQALDFAGVVLTRLAVLLSLLAAVGMVAAAVVLWLGVQGDVALVLALALPQLPYLIFICVAALLAGMLQSQGRFAIPAAAPVLLNVILIAVIYWGRDIWLLPYAVLGIGMAQCGMQLVALHRCGMIPRLRWHSTPQLRELRRALLPVLFASGVYQINALLDSVIALWLVPAAGAVTVLYFANRLLQFPMALVAHAIGTAITPDLARQASQGWAVTGDSLRRAGAVQAAMLLPASVGLMVCAQPLVDLIYRTGAFDATAAARCTLATQLFACGLVPVAANKLFVRACHAHRDQRSPVIISLFAVTLNLGLNIALVLTPLQEAGLALASSLSAMLTMVAYSRLLSQRGARCWHIAAWWRPMLSSAVMALAVISLLHSWTPEPDAGMLAQAGRLVCAILLGMVVYGVLGGRDAWCRYRQAGTTTAPATASAPEDGT